MGAVLALGALRFHGAATAGFGTKIRHPDTDLQLKQHVRAGYYSPELLLTVPTLT